MCARKYIHEKKNFLSLVGYFFLGFVLVVLLRSHPLKQQKGGSSYKSIHDHDEVGVESLDLSLH